MIALYSVNLRVMGKPNVALITEPTVFSMVDFGGMPEQWAKPLLLLLIVIVAKILVDMFFASEAGLAMRATGGNARMARAQGISTDFHTMRAWRCRTRWWRWPARCSRRARARPTSRWAWARS